MKFSLEQLDAYLRWIGKSEAWFTENVEAVERKNYAVSRLGRTLCQDKLIEEGAAIVFWKAAQPPNHFYVIVDGEETFDSCLNMAFMNAGIKYLEKKLGRKDE